MPDWFFRSLTEFELITWHALEGAGKRGGENEQDVCSACPTGARALRRLCESRFRAHSELVARWRTHLCCKSRHSGCRMAPCRAAFMRSRARCYARPGGTASRRVDATGFMTPASGGRTTRPLGPRSPRRTTQFGQRRPQSVNGVVGPMGSIGQRPQQGQAVAESGHSVMFGARSP